MPHPFKPGLEETLLLSRGEDDRGNPRPGDELYRGEIEDMADAILLGRPTRVSLAESRGNVAALSALLQSAQSGRVVTV